MCYNKFKYLNLLSTKFCEVTMKNGQTFIERIKEYEKLKGELESLTNGLTVEKNQLKTKYQQLSTDAIGFCRSDGFMSVMQVLCRINAGKLKFSPSEGLISLYGRTPQPMPFDCDNCFDKKEESKKLMFAIKSGNPTDESLLGKLCVGFVTLKEIARSAESLYNKAVERLQAETDLKSQKLRQSVSRLEDELFSSAEEKPDTSSKKGIFIASKSASSDSAELKRLSEKYGVDANLFKEDIVLSGESGIGSVFVSVNDNDKSTTTFHKFVNGIFYKNFTKFSVDELSVACIESNKFSTLPLAELHRGLVTHGEYESNFMPFSYGDVADDEEKSVKLLNQILTELANRKTLFGPSALSHDIGEYNLNNKYNKIPHILLLINGYPQLVPSEEAYNNLVTIMKDGAKYGIYTVIFGQNNPLSFAYGSEIRMDFYSIGAKEIRYSDQTVKFVSISEDEQYDLRKASSKTVKNTETLFLDELLANKLSISEFGKEITIPIGLADGSIYYFASSVDGSKTKYNSSPFTLIIGSTGKGKSAFLHTLILSGGMNYSPDELLFYIVDFKAKNDSAEFAPYLYEEGVDNLYIPHVKYLSMKSKPENVYDVIDMINNLANERAAIFSQAKVKDFMAYNTSAEVREKIKRGELPHVPQIYFLIDEYITMLEGGVEGSAENRMETEAKFNNILTRIRTSGVGIIFSGQKCVFNDGTKALIGNRMSFDPGGENLLSQMFGFEYKGDDDPSSLYKKIGGKIGFAASVRSASSTQKAVVRTAYAGDHMGERQLAIAKAIREKYSDKRYYGKQIIPGEDVMENGDRFLEEKQSKPVSVEKMRLQSKEGDMHLSLYLGVSSMSSEPVPFRYYLQKYHSGLIFAKESKQAKIEQNIALSFLRYQAVNGSKPNYKSVILNSLSVGEAITDMFGNVIGGKELNEHPLISLLNKKGYENLVEHNTSALEIADAIVKMEEKRKERFTALSHKKQCDRSPYLFILHDSTWLSSLKNYMEAEMDDGEEKVEEVKVEKPVKTMDEEFAPPAELLEMMGGEDEDNTSIFASIMGFDETEEIPKVKEEKKIKVHREGEVLTALKNLIMDGNKQNIYVLFACDEEETVNKIGGVKLNKLDLEKFGSVVFGSDSVRKTKNCSNDENQDCCFVLPQEIKARLYDFSANAEKWWKDFEEFYK